jgi:D-amino-acid oxidase
VHFFPRTDGWLLGQTREPGTIDNDGEWQGKPTSSPEVEIGGVSVPSPIIDLNRQLLKAWVGQDFSDDGLVGRFGYRYYRDPNDSGVRLEKDDFNGAPLVHNYGHGGSGITMSWGCALQAARLLHEAGVSQAEDLKQASQVDMFIQTLLLNELAT